MSKEYRNKEWLEDKYVKQELTTTQVASLAGVSPSCIAGWLKRHDIPFAPHGRGNVKDITGQRFERLVALKRIRRGPYRSKYLCVCDCGKEKTINRSSLVGGLTTSCGCKHFEIVWQGVGRLSKSYWNRIVKGAESRGLEISITIEDAWNLYQEQDEMCALSGLPIFIVRDYTRKHEHHTASLDRIDNDKGYVLGNVQWVHRELNMMRRSMSMERFVYLCAQVCAHNTDLNLLRKIDAALEKVRHKL